MNEKEVMTRASMSGDYKENMSFMTGLWPKLSKPTSDLKGHPFLKQTDIRRWKAASGRFLAAVTQEFPQKAGGSAGCCVTSKEFWSLCS